MNLYVGSSNHRLKLYNKKNRFVIYDNPPTKINLLLPYDYVCLYYELL